MHDDDGNSMLIDLIVLSHSMRITYGSFIMIRLLGPLTSEKKLIMNWCINILEKPNIIHSIYHQFVFRVNVLSDTRSLCAFHR